MIPNTIDTNSTQKQLSIANSISKDHTMIPQQMMTGEISNKILPEEIQYKSTCMSQKDYELTNNIVTKIANDICNTTLTKGINPMKILKEDGWENITKKTNTNSTPTTNIMMQPDVYNPKDWIKVLNAINTHLYEFKRYLETQTILPNSILYITAWAEIYCGTVNEHLDNPECTYSNVHQY
jgi:hypothetical protein